MVLAGFAGFQITWRAEVYDGAPQSSSAAEFGTQGINFCAHKPRDEQEWERALAGISCTLPSTAADAQNLSMEWPREAKIVVAPDRREQ